MLNFNLRFRHCRPAPIILRFSTHLAASVLSIVSILLIPLLGRNGENIEFLAFDLNLGSMRDKGNRGAQASRFWLLPACAPFVLHGAPFMLP